MGVRILLVNLDALGTVLATTAQLPAIKRTYPQSHVTWITRKNALPLLANNPFIDHLVEWNDENRMVLQQQKFELALNADKSRPARVYDASMPKANAAWTQRERRHCAAQCRRGAAFASASTIISNFVLTDARQRHPRCGVGN
jgi:ADP-heptose:LPS heptosyltransferase